MRYVSQVILRGLLSEQGVPFETERTYTLGEKTLLVGPNGAGKSAVSHGIRLALRGSTDDYQGRDNVKDPGALALMASFDGDGEVYAGVKLSDGGLADWTLTRENGANKRPEHNAAGIPAGCFVLDGIRAALAGDERTARKHFLGWVASGQSELDVMARVHSHLHEAYRARAAALAPVNPGATPADILLLVQASAAAEVKRSGDEADAYDRTAAVGLDGERPSDEEVTRLTRLAAQWRAFWQTAVAWETWIASGARSKADLYVERAELVAKRDHARAGEEHYRGLVASQGTTVHGVAVAALAFANSAQCPVCNLPSSPEHLHAMGAWHEAQNGVHGQAARDSESGRASWATEVANLGGQIRALDFQLDRAPDTAPAEVTMTAQDAWAQVAAVEAELQRVNALRANWEGVRRARDAAAALRSSLAPLKELVAVCTDAAKGMLRKSADDFEARVQRYLPERWTFKLRLTDEENPEREVFEVALIVHGVGKGYTSGSQRDALMMAIAMAVVESGASTAAPAAKGKGKSKAKAKLAAEALAIAIPEDRFRDEDTLRELLRAWSAFPGQVIVESTIKPSRIGKDWTVVEIGKVAKEAGTDSEVKDPEVLAHLTGTTGNATVGLSPPPESLAGLVPVGPPPPVAVPPVAPVEPPSLFLPPRATDTERTALHALTYTDTAINAMPRAAVTYVLRHNLKPDQCQIHGDGTVTIRGLQCDPKIPRGDS